MDSKDVSIRDINESDIPFILKYWFHSPPAYLDAIGVDVKKMPTEESMKTALLEKISINDHLPDSKLNALVIEYHGQPVGFHTVNPIVEGDYGIFHAHIWNPELRGQGIATKSYLLACGEFMRRFELKKIIFKTPLQNTAAIRLKEKLGIRKLGQEEVNFGIIRDGTLAQVFEISAEELPVLLQLKDLR